MILHRQSTVLVSSFVFSFLYVCSATNAFAAILSWEFVTTDGGTTIAGVFTTDGSFTDTQGTGNHVFEVMEWKSITLNGGDTGIPPERLPTTPTSAAFFLWNRDSQSISNPGGTLLSAEHLNNGTRESFIQLSFFPNGSSQSRLQDLVDSSPLIQFVPTEGGSSFAPIPEASTYAVFTGGLLLVWVVWRRGHFRRLLRPICSHDLVPSKCS